MSASSAVTGEAEGFPTSPVTGHRYSSESAPTRFFLEPRVVSVIRVTLMTPLTQGPRISPGQDNNGTPVPALP
ncbi:hypothetical protein GCM10009550_63030 [Actinocorallia libanotica]|uniref:Uncharacterized protein n=1 Tax=Actinocorallia libanotica TaxID=46162 RepID=A0ABN1RV07_9ACTN